MTLKYKLEISPALIETGCGEQRAKVTIDKYSVNLLTMVNGRQWSGFPLNVELAKMIVSVLDEYLSIQSNKSMSNNND